MQKYYQSIFIYCFIYSFSSVLYTSSIQTPSALHRAFMIGAIQEAQKLIATGANIHEIDLDKQTVLHSAISGLDPSKELVNLFCASKGNLDAKDIIGNTALHLAVKEDQGEIVNYLLNKGADLTTQNYYGNTPLHDAVIHSKASKEMIEILILHGSKIVTKNKQGTTLLQSAETLINPEKLNFLKKYQFLKQKKESLDIRKTLLGKIALKAYRDYFENQNPILLATLLGLDEQLSIPIHVIKKIEKIFLSQNDYFILLRLDNNHAILNPAQEYLHKFDNPEKPAFIQKLKQDFILWKKQA